MDTRQILRKMRDDKGSHICFCDGYIMVAVGLEESMVSRAAEYKQVFDEY